jgi:transcriptional adapter 2-alpha
MKKCFYFFELLIFILDDDKETEIQMKYQILQIYNARLDERIKRKKFVIERGLLDFNKQNALDKNRTKEEKEIYNLMKVFARFNTAEDHEKLVQGIIKEKQIRQRIEELKFYRKMGLKNFEDVEVNKHFF